MSEAPTVVHNSLSWMDGVSLGAIAGAITGVLPVLLTFVATVMAIIWYAMMIADWVRTRQEKRAALLAEELIAKAAHVATDLRNEAAAVATRLLAQTEASKRAAAEAFIVEMDCK